MSVRHNRWIIMMVALAFVGMVTSVRGGSLDAPAAPTNSASAMYTLSDIYNVLDTRTTNVIRRTGGFTEPTGGPTSGTMHTLDAIMTLVTNRSPVQKTGQTTSYMTNDDGTYQKGVAWPNPRFTIQSTNTSGSGPDDRTNCVLDNLTGLMWARNANIASNTVWNTNNSGAVIWTNAFNAITNLSTGVVNCVTYGGYNDWRLPNVCELQSLIAWKYYSPPLCNTAGTGQCTESAPFTGVQGNFYWSSTTRAADTGYAWDVYLTDGYVYSQDKTDTRYVWPVRGGQ